jgi:alpha/beta hydrolase fold
MSFVHDRDKRSAFPFRASALEDHRMSSNAWVLSQDAELHLRGGVRARVTWPPATAADRPPLLVLVPGRGEQADADLCRELAIRIPAVVLAAAPGTFGAAREALEWGADHAGELGADADQIVLAGDHRGATEVAALARHARDRGWPAIAHVVLIDPRAVLTTADALAPLFRVAIRSSGSTREGTRAASGPAGRERAVGTARRRGARR